MKRSPLTFWLTLGSLLIVTACATIGPPQPPSLELAKPPSDLRATRKGDHVSLIWTDPTITTDRQKIRSMGRTRICRAPGTDLTQCGVPVGEVSAQPTAKASGTSKPKVERSYVDSLPERLQSDDPSAFVTYAVEVLNAAGRGAGLSNRVRISLARTQPPPQDFAARVTGQGIVLTWTNELSAPAPASSVHYVYRVYRRLDDSLQQILAGEVPAGSERNLSLTDSSIEWEKTYEYHANTVTAIVQENKSQLQIEGDDTAEIKVFAHDIFPPAVPAGLQAVASGPGQKTFIDLVWSPVSDIDLEGYNVYRRENGGDAVRVNSEPVKTPAYRDANVMSGKRYFYSVSAVDIRGNESERSEEAGETIP